MNDDLEYMKPSRTRKRKEVFKDEVRDSAKPVTKRKERKERFKQSYMEYEE